MASMASGDRIDTLSEALARAVATAPRSIAIVDRLRRHDWTALSRAASSMATWLADHGVTPGDAVAIRLPNGFDYLATIFAVARLGAVAVHLNARFGATELQDVLARSRATLLVTRDVVRAIDLAATFRAIDRDELPLLRHVRSVDAHPIDMHDATVTATDRALPAAPCLIFTSSGTTSTPKLVVHDQASIAGHAGDVAARIGLDRPDAVLLSVMPLCGTFGNVAAMAAVAGGATIVCVDIYEPAAVASLIRRERVTHLFADDRMIGQLADLADGKPYHDVRFSAVAAFHPGSVASIARGIDAGFEPHSIYGSSEVQALFAVAPQRDGRQVAVVPVSATASIAYRTDSASSVWSAAGDGELLIRAPSSFSHYLGDAAQTTAARDEDGFFATGDHATGDGDAFVFRSRLGDVLRLGGFLVNPQEIEGFLQSIAGVDAAQVVAIIRDGRSVAVAFVIAATGVKLVEAALIQACRASLARYKVPVRVVVVTGFPSIAGANGVKIQRGRLREMASGLMAADASIAPATARVPTSVTETCP